MSLAVAARVRFSLQRRNGGVDDVVEIGERRLVFAGLTLSASINSHFLVVLEVFGDFDDLLAGELGVGKTRAQRTHTARTG